VEKGGTFYVSEHSGFLLKNCSVTNSYAKYGSIFYFQENYEGLFTIENVDFYLCEGMFDLIDAGQTNMVITNSTFRQNLNNFCFLVFSNIEFVNSRIIDHQCFTNLPGCIINAITNSVVIFRSSIFENISSFIEEGNVYLEDSVVQCVSSQMKTLMSNKNKGSCFSSYTSTLFMNDSQLTDYTANCLYSMESYITIHNSIFDNSLLNETQNLYDYGTIYCENCFIIMIDFSSFIGNSKTINGSAIFIISNSPNLLNTAQISNSYFYDNNALEAGTIYVYNQNSSLILNIFEGNSANRGGGIFCDNDSNFAKVNF